MVQKSVKYNPVKDISEVDQFGFIDLVKAFQNGYVPGDVETISENYNDIDEPSSIVGKPSDAFEAMRMQDAILANVKKGTKSLEPATVKSSSDTDKN